MTSETRHLPAVGEMSEAELVIHFRDIGFKPDAFGFISERQAAQALGVCQKKLADLRRDGTFELGEYRKIGKEWRYQLRALMRYHEDQFAPDSWG